LELGVINFSSHFLIGVAVRIILSRNTTSREKVRKPRSLLWGGMASGGLGAAAPIMAFSLESPLDISHGQAHEIKFSNNFPSKSTKTSSVEDTL